MRAVIHVGMHKTGSSSIQNTYFQFKDPGFTYVDFEIANHSPMLALLFGGDDVLRNYSYFSARGPEFQKTLPQLRETYLEQLKAQLEGAGDKTVVFSAEDISSPRFKSANKQLAALFETYTDDIEVFGYVRPPSGFMISAFQQMLKAGTVHFPAHPTYRDRFEQIDEAFGRERVTLKEFTRKNLLGGDAVKDFAQSVGIASVPDDQVIRTNESLSLEATALLYVQREHGTGFVKGFPQALQANNRFFMELARIGTGKLALSEKMLATTTEQIREDIDWIEERVGHAFSDSGKAPKGAIESLDDLVDVALQSYDDLVELIGEDAPKFGPATMDNLIHALEALRVKCYDEAAPGVKPAYSIDEDLHVRRKLANILWTVENIDKMPDDPKDRRAAFDQAKLEFSRKARDVIKRLPNHKLVLGKETGNG